MVKWTPKSENDLEEIINFTELTLTTNPLAGAIFESNPLFYKLNHKGNTIFYCENPKDKNLYIVYIQPRKTDLKLDRLNQNEVA